MYLQNVNLKFKGLYLEDESHEFDNSVWRYIPLKLQLRHLQWVNFNETKTNLHNQQL